MRTPCNCKSYNRDDWPGTEPEVALDAPAWSGRNTICIDPCVVPVIKALWAAGIVTTGCCCGHNRQVASVFLKKTVDVPRAVEIINEVDGRDMHVTVWAYTPDAKEGKDGPQD